MADQNARLDITPRVIDTGAQVIQVAHVTSAGFGTAHPLRPVGIGLMLVGAGLLIFEVAKGGLGAFTLKAAGSPLLWIAFAATGVGLFLTVFARRFLVIRTVDGARTTLPAEDDQASAAVIARIREAMETGQPALRPGRAQIEHQPSAQASLPAAATPAEQPAALSRTGPPQRTLPSHGLPAGRGASPTQPLGHARAAEGYVNGHHAEAANGAFEPSGPRRQAPPDYGQPRESFSHHPGLGESGPGSSLEQRLQAQREAMAFPGPSMHAPAPHRDDPAEDLHALIEHVRRADVQHKEALLDLLRVVDEHYRGRASREDALAHWRSFADYARQYLGSVEGLTGYTERFERHMLGR